MINLLLIEQAIVEAIGEFEKKFDDLVSEIGVDSLIIRNAITSLIEANVIVYNGFGYKLKSSFMTLIRSSEDENLNSDEIDYFYALENLQICKLSLDSFEEKLFQIHLKNFNDFVLGIKQKHKYSLGQKMKKKLKDKKIFAFGFGSYGDVIRASVSV